MTIKSVLSGVHHFMFDSTPPVRKPVEVTEEYDSYNKSTLRPPCEPTTFVEKLDAVDSNARYVVRRALAELVPKQRPVHYQNVSKKTFVWISRRNGCMHRLRPGAKLHVSEEYYGEFHNGFRPICGTGQVGDRITGRSKVRETTESVEQAGVPSLLVVSYSVKGEQ